MVKELKEKLIRGKTLPPLNKVEDINVITGVLKDFLRNLPQPLLTFRLNKAFMEAAGEFVSVSIVSLNCPDKVFSVNDLMEKREQTCTCLLNVCCFFF